jgi:glycosyltransferase involved in cell wall biosynthesis
MTPPDRSEPILSIIIPSRDRPDLLAKCLRALARQFAYGLFEVLVGDDSRKSRYSKIFDYPFQITVVRANSRGAAAARNACARVARGLLLGLLDDDAIPCENWVERLISGLETAGPNTALTGTH